MRMILASILSLICFAVPHRLSADEPAPKTAFPELEQARKTGWELASLILSTLEAGDKKKWPGATAWLAEFRKATKGIDLKIPVEKWPAFDVDALVTRNPQFWVAYYEIAPGDSGLMLLHAGLLLAAGEANRAGCLCILAGQRPGVPKEIQTGFDVILAQQQAVSKKANGLVQEGIEFHDKGKYDDALKKYREALKVWPQNGFAHYEYGFTLRTQERSKDTKKNPADFSKAVIEAFAASRKHDPWQVNAYQGSDRKVIAGLQALVRKGHPAWKQVLEDRPKLVKDKVILDLAEAYQEAQQQELAITAHRSWRPGADGMPPRIIPS